MNGILLHTNRCILFDAYGRKERLENRKKLKLTMSHTKCIEANGDNIEIMINKRIMAGLTMLQLLHMPIFWIALFPSE